jgi:hypothetical protein
MAFGRTGRFFGQLSLCFRQRMPMLQALDLIAGDVPDPEWSAAVFRVRDRIAAGESLTAALEALPSSFARDVLPFLAAAENEGLLEPVCETLAAWPDAGANGLEACLARALAEASLRLRRGATLIDAWRAAQRPQDPEPLGAALAALGRTVFGPEPPDEAMARFPAVFGPALRVVLQAAFQHGNVETAFSELALALSRGWFAPRAAAEGDVVAVLEDDLEGRQPQFRRAAELLGLRYVVHDNAPDFVAWLERSFESVRLMSLDHDLGPSRERGGGRFDPGSGMQVVEALLKRRPAFPVIVHSSNPYDAPTMVRRLEEAGWTSQRIVPWGEEWIPTLWLELARTYARPRA